MIFNQLTTNGAREVSNRKRLNKELIEKSQVMNDSLNKFDYRNSL